MIKENNNEFVSYWVGLSFSDEKYLEEAYLQILSITKNPLFKDSYFYFSEDDKNIIAGELEVHKKFGENLDFIIESLFSNLNHLITFKIDRTLDNDIKFLRKNKKDAQGKKIQQNIIANSNDSNNSINNIPNKENKKPNFFTSKFKLKSKEVKFSPTIQEIKDKIKISNNSQELWDYISYINDVNEIDVLLSDKPDFILRQMLLYKKALLVNNKSNKSISINQELIKLEQDLQEIEDKLLNINLTKEDEKDIEYSAKSKVYKKTYNNFTQQFNISINTIPASWLISKDKNYLTLKSQKKQKLKELKEKLENDNIFNYLQKSLKFKLYDSNYINYEDIDSKITVISNYNKKSLKSFFKWSAMYYDSKFKSLSQKEKEEYDNLFNELVSLESEALKIKFKVKFEKYYQEKSIDKQELFNKFSLEKEKQLKHSINQEKEKYLKKKRHKLEIDKQSILNNIDLKLKKEIKKDYIIDSLKSKTIAFESNIGNTISSNQSTGVFAKNSILYDDILYIKKNNKQKISIKNEILSNWLKNKHIGDGEAKVIFNKYDLNIVDLRVFLMNNENFHYQDKLKQLLSKSFVPNSVDDIENHFNELYEIYVSDINQRNYINNKFIQYYKDLYQEKIKKINNSFDYKIETTIIKKGNNHFKELLSQGFKVEKHNIEVPNYDSWAKIKPGYRLMKRTESYQIKYVPYKNSDLGKVEVETVKTAFKLDFEQLPNLENYIINKFLNNQNRVSSNVLKNKFFILVYNKQTKQYKLVSIYDYDNSIYQSVHDFNLLSSKLNQASNNIYEDEKIRTRYLTLDDLKKLKDKELFNQEIKTEEDFIKSQFYLENSNLFLTFKNNFKNNYLSLLEGIKHLEKRKKPFYFMLNLNTDVSSMNLSTVKSNFYNLQYQNKLKISLDESNLNKKAKKIISQGYLDEFFLPTKEKATETQHIIQDTPISEEGKFIIESDNLDLALEKIKDIGLLEDFYTTIPHNLVYHRKDYNTGTLTPYLDCYITGEKTLTLPKNKMIIHGMTGTLSDEESVDRLKKIVELGGLKSIAQRRNLDLKLKTLSPVGDIASGIDHSVPTTINYKPNYGSDSIIFIMKPEIIQRRDVFFSNKDFGGGHNRYEEYNHYAKIIGQENIHHPASHEARIQHLYHGGVDRDDNEAWFKDQISLDEIAFILVDKRLNSHSHFQNLLDSLVATDKETFHKIKIYSNLNKIMEELYNSKFKKII